MPKQIKDITTTRTAATMLGTDLLVGQAAAGGAGSTFKVSVAEIAKRRGEFNVLDYGAVGDGSTDDAAAIQAAHDAASAASPVGVVVLPPKNYRINSTVTLKANMIGLGGNGYNSTMARANFISNITDGTATLKALNRNGLDLRNFSVSGGITGTANPNPSGGNVQNTIGLQLGKAPCLITAATKANPCVITTKYLHTFATGDSITISNVVGMTELNGNTYTVTRVSGTSFSLNSTDSSAYTTYTSGGMARPSDSGTGSACSRGTLQSLSFRDMASNCSISGWLNSITDIKSHNGTIGFDGGYLNTCTLDVVTENCWQAVQLLGCASTSILRIEDEGDGSVNTGGMGASSTIDYSSNIECIVWATEGTRRVTNTPWLSIGGVSYCSDIHIRGGVFTTAGTAVSVALANVDNYTLPDVEGGYSTTASTLPTKTFSTVWEGSTTNPSIGNGTLTCRYLRERNLIHFQCNITFGSTTFAGSGNWSFTLPVASYGNAIGSVKILDSGTRHYVGVCHANGTTLTCYTESSQVGSAYPHTWATSDTLQITITYPVQ